MICPSHDQFIPEYMAPTTTTCGQNSFEHSPAHHWQGSQCPKPSCLGMSQSPGATACGGRAGPSRCAACCGQCPAFVPAYQTNVESSWYNTQLYIRCSQHDQGWSAQVFQCHKTDAFLGHESAVESSCLRKQRKVYNSRRGLWKVLDRPMAY